MKYWTWYVNEKRADGLPGKRVRLHTDAGSLIFTAETLKAYMQPKWPGFDFTHFEATSSDVEPKKQGKAPAEWFQFGILRRVYRELGIEEEILGATNANNPDQRQAGQCDPADFPRILHGRSILRPDGDSTGGRYHPVRSKRLR
jgi:hypothetical protein